MADTTLILRTLVEGTAEARKGLDNVTKGVEQLGDSGGGLNKLSTALKDNAEGFATIGVAAAAAFTAIVALGTMSVMQASKLQDLRQSFDTLLGSAVEGKKLFLEIQKMAVATPFTSADLAGATSTMLGFGVAQEKVLPIMSQLGDIAMGNNERFQRLALAFAQVSAAGRLQGQDLLQMVNSGFNPLQEISKKTGESMLELKERMSDGRISVKEVEEAMKSATSAGGRFEGGMLKASKTFSGVMSTFRDNIGITLAALGGFANGEVVQGGLLDSLTQAMNKLMPALDRVTQWAAQNPEVAKNILLIGAAVTGLIAGIVSLWFIVGKIMIAWQALSAVWVALSGFVTATLWPALTALGSALAAISAPVWIVIGVIASLIAAGVALYTHWDTVKAKSIEIFWGIGDFISSTWTAISDKTAEIWNGITAFFSGVWNTITEIFKFAVALVTGIVIAAFGAMGIDIVSVLTNMYNALTVFWSMTKLVFEVTLLAIKTVWEAVWTRIKTFFSGIWESVVTNLTAAWTSITGLVDKGLGMVHGLFQSFSTPIAAAWDALWTSLSSTVVSVWEGVKATIKSSINYIVDMINKVIEAANSLARSGAGKLWISIPTIPTIPRLAEGGIVTKPTLAMIGEGGESEAVIPLSKMKDMGAGGGVNIYFTGTFGKDAAESIGDMIMEKLARSVAI